MFNEKVIAALKLYKHLDTALFIERVHRMWCIINVTYPDTGHHLNDEDRKPITSKSDDRLAFLEKNETSFKLMDSFKKGKRIQGLTGDTSNTLHMTLLGLVDLTKTWLHKGFNYILLGKIQSDRLEKEFSIYHQSSGGIFLFQWNRW